MSLGKVYFKGLVKMGPIEVSYLDWCMPGIYMNVCKKCPEPVPSLSRLWALKGLQDAQGMAQGRETMSLVPTLGFGCADAKRFFLSLTQGNPSAWALFSVDAVYEGKPFWKEDYLCQKSKRRNKSCGIESHVYLRCWVALPEFIWTACLHLWHQSKDFDHTFSVFVTFLLKGIANKGV